MKGRFNAKSGPVKEHKHRWALKPPFAVDELSKPAATAIARQDHLPAVPATELTVTAMTENDIYRRLEPIVIDITIRNDSNKKIKVVTFGDQNHDVLKYTAYDVIVHGFRSLPLTWTRFRLLQKLPNRCRAIDLDPGDGLQDWVVANLVFDMTSEGRYTIIVEVPYLLPERNNREMFAPSNPVEVSVAGLPNVGKKDIW